MSAIRRRKQFDVGMLRKGMWLDTAALENAVGMVRTAPRFWSAVLNLGDKIKRERGIVCCTAGSGATLRLRLMSDAEASAYTTRRALRAAQTLDRCAYELETVIDTSNLTAAELAAHNHAERVVGALADAAKAEARKHARLLEFIPVRGIKD